MKIQNIFVSVLIVAAAVAAGVYVALRPAVVPPSSEISAETGDKTFALMCDAGKSMMITFHLPEDLSVDVALSDGRKLSLANTSGPAGASYTSADGSAVLGLTGSTLMLTENAAPAYTNCALASTSGM